MTTKEIYGFKQICRIIVKMARIEVVSDATRTIIVCDTCREIAAQIGSGKYDKSIAVLNIREHGSHKLTTFDRPKGRGGSYSVRDGVHLNTEYLL